MNRRNLMIAAVLAIGAGTLGSAVAQGYGNPDSGPGMRGMMQGGMGPGGMMQGGMGPGGMGQGGMGPGMMGGRMGGMGGMMGGRMMDPAARAEQRLSRLKADLKITEKQEPLWQAFAEKSKAEAGKEAETMRQHMANDKPMTAPERLAQMQSGMKQRLASMEAVNEAFNRLYAGLTAEQKAAADKHFSQMGRGMGPGGPGGPGRSGPPSAGGQGSSPQAAPDSHKH